MSTPYYSKFETDEKLLNTLVGSTPIGDPNGTLPSTGNIHSIGAGAGTYANWGGVVIPENNIGTLRRINGEYFVSLTEIELTGYVQKTDIIDAVNSTSTDKPSSANSVRLVKINPWTASSYLSNSQVNHLGKDWVCNAATVAGDVPSISSKWIERLPAYNLEFSQSLELGSINIFDPLKKRLGEHINSSGVLTANAFNFGNTGLMLIKNGQTLTISNVNMWQTSHALFTSLGVLIPGTVVGGFPNNNTTPYSFTNSLGYDAFVIFSFRNDTTALPMIEIGAIASAYVPFSKKIKDIYTTNFVKKDTDFDVLFRIHGNLVDVSKGVDRTNNSGGALANIDTVPGTSPSWFGFTTAAFKVTPNKLCRLPNNAFNTTVYEFGSNGIFLRKTTKIYFEYFKTSSDCYYCRVEFNRDQLKGFWLIEDFTTESDVYTGNLILKKEVSAESFKDEIPTVRQKIKIPSVFYFLNGLATYINKEQLVENYQEGKNYLTPKTSTNYKDGIKFTKTANFTEELLLKNEGFKLIDRKTIEMKVASLVTDNGAFKWLPIGDSYTAPAYWIKEVQTTGNAYFCPNVSSVGTKRGHSANGGGDYNEGLSGWKLYSSTSSQGGFMNTIYSPSQFAGFSPFLHVAGKNYYGCTRFWKDVVVGNVYANIETATKFGFSASTGLRTGTVAFPMAVGDLMYNYALSKFQEWNGTAWVDSTVVNADFSFNIAKYRSVWDIPALNLVSVMLGINDFGSDYFGFEATYANYKISLDTLIASAKSDNSAVKIAICIPPISYGKNGVELVAQRNATMAKLKTKLIEDYDLRTAENIYLIDLCISIEDKCFGNISTDNAWTTLTQVSELDSKIIQNDTIHPNNSYLSLAKNMAAFIQSVR